MSISNKFDIISRLLNRKKDVQQPADQIAPAPQPVQPQSTQVDVVLVTAAIAAYLGKSTDQIIVRGIRRIGTEETAWSRAGKLDSLQ